VPRQSFGPVAPRPYLELLTRGPATGASIRQGKTQKRVYFASDEVYALNFWCVSGHIRTSAVAPRPGTGGTSTREHENVDLLLDGLARLKQRPHRSNPLKQSAVWRRHQGTVINLRTIITRSDIERIASGEALS
jgi:hypothetical protein